MHTFAVIGFIWFALVFVLFGVLYFWPLSVQRFLRRRKLSKIATRKVLPRKKGKLIYFEAGEGSLLVLLHGAGDQADTWVSLVPALARDYRLIMPDLPDHGASAGCGSTLTLGDVYNGLEDLLEQRFRGEQVTLMGNSMGGWISLLYALHHKDRVKALILEDSGGIRKDTETPNLIPKTVDEARELLNATRGPDGPDVPKFVLRHLIELAKKGPIAKLAKSGGDEYYLDDRLQALDLPVRLLWGEDDGLLPPEYGKALAEKIPGSTLHFIERSGHIPHLEKPDAVIELVCRFLDQQHK